MARGDGPGRGRARARRPAAAGRPTAPAHLGRCGASPSPAARGSARAARQDTRVWLGGLLVPGAGGAPGGGGRGAPGSVRNTAARRARPCRRRWRARLAHDAAARRELGRPAGEGQETDLDDADGKAGHADRSAQQARGRSPCEVAGETAFFSFPSPRACRAAADPTGHLNGAGRRAAARTRRARRAHCAGRIALGVRMPVGRARVRVGGGGAKTQLRGVSHAGHIDILHPLKMRNANTGRQPAAQRARSNVRARLGAETGWHGDSCCAP